MGSAKSIKEESIVEYRQSNWSLHIDRWLGLSAAMIMMACNGLTYTYAVYSEFVKRKLHYHQEQTDDLGAAKDFGAVIGLVSGIMYFLFPPWFSVVIGAVMHLFGYGMVLMTLTGKTAASFWPLCFYFAVGSGGDNWVDTACIMTSLESFEDYKGTAVGILKSQLGLSAAIFVMVYEAFFDSSVINFLYLVTLVPTVVYLALAFCIKPFSAQEQDKDEADISQRFQMAYGSVVLLGMFLMASMTFKEIFDLEESADVLFAITMLIVLAVMFVIPILYRPLDLFRNALCMNRRQPQGLDQNAMHKSTELHTKHSNGFGTSDNDAAEESYPIKEYEDSHEMKSIQSLESEGGIPIMEHQSVSSNFWESLLGIDFWLVTFVVGSGAGSGLAIINNFAQIGKAMKSDGADVFVGIISIWSCYGRLAAGYGSDVMLNAGYPRPLCLFISQMAMCLCCLFLASGFIPALFIGSAIIGMAYGSYWTLVPAVISEVFGLRQVATLYKLLGMGPTVSAYLLSAKVLGALYDKETTRYQQRQTLESKEENTCYGRRCFGFGLLSLAMVCFLGAIACLWFTNRTRKFYSRTRHHPVPSS